MIEMKSYSTVEVAELLAISSDTLYRWIRAKKFYVPPVRLVGRVQIRLWTEQEVEAVRKYKADHFGEGQGRRSDVRKKKVRKPK